MNGDWLIYTGFKSYIVNWNIYIKNGTFGAVFSNTKRCFGLAFAEPGHDKC